MWSKFSISLLIFGLIHQVKCIDTPYSDMYLPDGADGFVCENIFFSIEYARQATNKMIDTFFYEKYFQRFPKLFEDTRLFNVRSDILLSWPAKPNENFFTCNPGKFRLISNIRGQIMGMVIINSKQHNNEVSFGKCKPVRSSNIEGNTEGNIESRLLDEYWSLAYPRFGYKCGSKYFPLSMIKSGNDIDTNYYFQSALEAKDRAICFEEYRGDQFIGDDLRLYPLHYSSSSKPGSGSQGHCRVVFDMKSRQFKGIINLKDKEAKCAIVWDLSSASSDTIYSPFSVLNMERMSEMFWPETCFGHRFKYKTIWLYIEFALKQWSTNKGGKVFNFPIVKEDGLRFWPVRTPETHANSLMNAFAIGHDTNVNVYGLYRAEVRDGILRKFQLCLNLPLHDIRRLQRKVSPGTSL
ncbi:BgtE-10142 [Blumeria graminis f. sp. tritici]|uniref:BgtE-10142 n=1 Tax=Blumeria graminis f. sp. tritici TaxID=62690 RepID=A0A9X9MPT8_BLUGR|nr:BgtE-10142 [Blumeria graminis f. sp. tritici]